MHNHTEFLKKDLPNYEKTHFLPLYLQKNALKTHLTHFELSLNDSAC